MKSHIVGTISKKERLREKLTLDEQQKIFIDEVLQKYDQVQKKLVVRADIVNGFVRKDDVNVYSIGFVDHSMYERTEWSIKVYYDFNQKSDIERIKSITVINSKCTVVRRLPFLGMDRTETESLPYDTATIFASIYNHFNKYM